MHDDISQRLAILDIDAANLERLCEDSTNPIVEALQDMRKRLVDLSSDIHAISRQLHPSILHDLGLADALQAEFDGFRSREQIMVKFEAELWFRGDGARRSAVQAPKGYRLSSFSDRARELEKRRQTRADAERRCLVARQR